MMVVTDWAMNKLNAWARAIACRDLASDLSSLRPGAGGQIVAPLHGYQRDLLVALLARESNQIEDALTDLFETTIDVAAVAPRQIGGGR